MITNKEGALTNLIHRLEDYYYIKDELSENILTTDKDNLTDIEINANKLEEAKKKLLQSFKKLFVIDETKTEPSVKLTPDVLNEFKTIKIEIYKLQQLRKALLESAQPKDRKYVMLTFNALAEHVVEKLKK